MNELFVPYQQALELKELRFDEPCFSYYNLDGTLSDRPKESGDDIKLQGDYKFDSHQNNSLNDDESCSAPTFSQAFTWFREKYKLESSITRANDYTWYKFNIYYYYLSDAKKYVCDGMEFNTYEEAELTCLKKLIELVKNKQNDRNI